MASQVFQVHCGVRSFLEMSVERRRANEMIEYGGDITDDGEECSLKCVKYGILLRAKVMGVLPETG